MPAWARRLVGATIPLALGLVMVIGGARGWTQTNVLRNRGVTTDAVIISFVNYEDCYSVSNRTECNSVNDPVVRFATRDGRVIEKRMNHPDVRARVGDHIRIVYDPLNPTLFADPKDFSLALMRGMFFGGCFFALEAMLIAAWSLRARRAWLSAAAGRRETVAFLTRMDNHTLALSSTWMIGPVATASMLGLAIGIGHGGTALIGTSIGGAGLLAFTGFFVVRWFSWRSSLCALTADSQPTTPMRLWVDPERGAWSMGPAWQYLTSGDRRAFAAAMRHQFSGVLFGGGRPALDVRLLASKQCYKWMRENVLADALIFDVEVRGPVQPKQPLLVYLNEEIVWPISRPRLAAHGEVEQITRPHPGRAA